MAGKSSWDQANRRQKLGLVWRIRKKISQIIKDYFYLPFFLLIILWFTVSTNENNKLENIVNRHLLTLSTLYTVKRFVSISDKFDICTDVGLNRTRVEAKKGTLDT
jgi:hypothetical protein